eukprot:2537422-Rhodomonas_salina.1
MLTASNSTPSPHVQAGLGSALSWRSALTRASSRASLTAAASAVFPSAIAKLTLAPPSTRRRAMAAIWVRSDRKPGARVSQVSKSTVCP